MEKIRRWLSTKAYKRIKLFIFGFIILFNIGVILIGGTLIHFNAPETFGTIRAGVWQIFKDILDPGFLSSEGTGITKAIEIFVILICMVTFTGAIIGYISNIITTIIENSVGGPKRMYLKNHIIILNWNNRAADIITEYLYTEECEDIVILTTRNRDEVAKEVETTLFETNHQKKQKSVNYVVKQGEPFAYSELEAICAEKAKTIIVLSDKDSEDGALRTLKTVMMVSQMNADRKDCTIVVETDSQNMYELVCRIKENNNIEIIPAHLNKLLGKLLAHTALQPQLNIVFAELLSQGGNEFHGLNLDEVDGINAGDPEEKIIDDYMKRYNYAIPLITTKSFANNDSNKLFVLSEEKSNATKKRAGFAGDYQKLSLKKIQEIPKKIVVLFGSNSKMEYIINSFRAYIDNYGEDKLTVYFVDLKEKLAKIEEHPSFVKMEIEDRYDIFEIRKIMNQLDLEEMDTIVILSDDMVSAAEYDTGALISLVDINRELDKIPKDKRPEVIVEILNPGNHEIVQHYNIENVIVSNKYISSMIALLGDDGSTFDLIYDILTFDNEVDDYNIDYVNNADTKELYIKSCGDYFEKLPEFDSVYELIRSIYYSSNKQDIPIGIIYGEETKNMGQYEKFDRTYTFAGNLDKSEHIRLHADDQIVFFSGSF